MKNNNLILPKEYVLETDNNTKYIVGGQQVAYEYPNINRKVKSSTSDALAYISIFINAAAQSGIAAYSTKKEPGMVAYTLSSMSQGFESQSNSYGLV